MVRPAVELAGAAGAGAVRLVTPVLCGTVQCRASVQFGTWQSSSPSQRYWPGRQRYRSHSSCDTLHSTASHPSCSSLQTQIFLEPPQVTRHPPGVPLPAVQLAVTLPAGGETAPAAAALELRVQAAVHVWLAVHLVRPVVAVLDSEVKLRVWSAVTKPCLHRTARDGKCKAQSQKSS